MKTSHTPGPWTANRMLHTPSSKDRRCGFVINGPDADPLPVRICDLRVPEGVDGFGEGQSNARLIAAAPEMLEALTGLVDAIRTSVAVPTSINAAYFAARAIIGKVEGGTL